MKAFRFVLVGIAMVAVHVSGQVLSSLAPGNSAPDALGYTRGARDGNSQIWERMAKQTNMAGRVISVKHSYTELNVGMNHLVDGNWVASRAEIDILPDGSGAATNAQYQAYFPGNIYQGAIEMVTVDGQELQSRPTLLCYVDGTNSAILADLQSSEGVLIGSNQVVYPNAFEGLNADLRYTFNIGTFEQDVVLRQSPPPPEAFGFDRKTTRIEVMTEFLNMPEPVQDYGVYDPTNDLQDTMLGFGNSKLIVGKAFSTTNAMQKEVEGATVFKSWLEFEGRTFLIEKLPYQAIAPQIANLPMQSSVTKKVHSTLMASSFHSPIPQLPVKRAIQACTNSILFAKNDSNRKPGVVLDYVALNVTAQNFTFQADTTYWMPSWGYFAIQGNAVFEGGTVIKFAAGSGNFQLIYPTISWQGNPYRPVIMTAQDDNSVGETISGSTGTPSGYYGSGVLVECNNNLVLPNLRMCYLQTGLNLYTTAEFDNLEVVNCQNPIIHAYCPVTINNGLFFNIGGTAAISTGSGTSVSGNQLTIDNCNIFADSTTPSLTLANSLVTGTTNAILAGTGTLSTNQVIILSSNSGIFQTVGAGSHYLANGSPYRAVGTNAIPSGLLASLATKTTYPPVVYSNQSFTVSTNLQIQPVRDTNSSPDLGFHYEALDYITDQLTVTNSTLTITNGVAIACYNEPGILLRDGAAINSIGTPLSPNWLVRYQAVQDQSVLLGGTNIFSGQNISAAPIGTSRPSATIQFTHFSTPANGGFHIYHGGTTSFGTLSLQHNELWGGTNNFSGPTSGATAAIFNNLFFRSGIVASNATSSATLAWTNNLIYGTVLSLVQPSSGNWSFFNNDVDSCVVDTNSSITNGFNAFINCSANFTGTSNIISTNAIGYLAGPLGFFYQPTNSPLIDMGDAPANQLALGHFTTQTNQAVETNTIVDIGYHYVALGANGQVLTNASGVPYYISDAAVNTNPAPTIVIQPSSVTAILTSNASFSVTASGAATLTYQWWFNATNILAGATNATLTITNVQFTNAGNYFVVITNAYGSVTSSIASLTVWAYPTISITNPISGTVIVSGANLLIGATASDSDTTITQVQFFQGTNSLGILTNAPYVMTWSNVIAGTYNLTAQVTDSNGLMATSATVVVYSVLPLPGMLAWWKGEDNALDSASTNNGTVSGMAYTNGRVGQTFVFNGSNTVFSATLNSFAGGNSPESAEGWVYINALPSVRSWIMLMGAPNTGSEHWLLHSDGSTQLGVWAGTQATPTLTAGVWTHLALTFDGTNLCCYTNGVLQSSQAATFSFASPLAVTLGQPQGSEQYFNGMVDEFSIYNRALSSGEVAAIYNAGTSGKSILLNAPIITAQPTNCTVAQGGAAAFSVTASGAATLTYQWYYTNSAAILGATNSSLVISNCQWSDATGYYVVVSNPYGGATSLNAYLNVLAAPALVAQPTNEIVYVGSNATFSVTAVGSLPIAYQWYGTNTGIISWATNSSFTVTNAQIGNADFYYVIVTNLYGIVSSTNAQLTVWAPPAITNQPQSLTVAVGSPATLSAGASGTAPLAYQWYGVNAGLLSGYTNSYLFFNSAQTNNADQYFVIVTNIAGSVTSSVAALAVVSYPTVAITNPPSEYAYFSGATNIALMASVTANAGVISQVQFFAGTNSLGVVTNAPFNLMWSNAPIGDYALTAVALDTGLYTTSAVVNVCVFSTNDLVLWLNADSITGVPNNSLLGSWHDSSAFADNAAQGPNGTKPLFLTNILNGHAVVRFDGLTNQLELARYPATNNFTVLMVAKPSQSVNASNHQDNGTSDGQGNPGQRYVFGGDYDLGYNGAETSLSMGTNGIGVYEYMHNSSGGDEAAPLALYNKNIGTGSEIIGILSSNQLPSIYFNGILVDVGLPSLRSLSIFGHTIGYGSSWGGAFGGDLPELMVFSRVLTPMENASVSGYLNNKYSVIPNVPLPPTNLVATAISSNQVLLTWANTATNFFFGFKIERRQGTSGNYQQIATSASALPYMDSGLQPGVTYYYRICAYNFVGNSPYCTAASATTFSSGTSFPSSDLKLWLRADLQFLPGTTNQPIGVWPDQSGNGNNIYQAVSSNQPAWITNAIGGLPIVRFNGTNTFFNVPPFLNSLTQAEVLIVLKASPIPSQQNPLWEMGGYLLTPGSYPETDGHTIEEDFGTDNNNYSYTFDSQSLPLTQYHVYEVVSQPNNWVAWINGLQLYQSTNNTAGFGGAPTANEAMLGAHVYAGLVTNFFSGDIAEVLIFDRGLSSSERSTVNNYLTAKYGASLTAPPTPYNVAATPISSSQIKLNWSEPLFGGATQVSVERATSSNGVYSVIAQLSANSLYDTNLAIGTTYFYRLRAFNSSYTVTNSQYSSIVQATTFTNVPTLPLPLSLWLKADTGVLTNSSGQINTWSDQSGNGNNATQWNPAAQPVLAISNGVSTVHFNGTNNFLGFSSFMTGATGAEAFVVLRVPTNYPATGHSLWEMGVNAFFPNEYPYVDGTLHDDFGSANIQSEGVPQQSIQQYHVYEVCSVTNNWESWINGLVQDENFYNQVNFSASPTLGMSTYQTYTVTWIEQWNYFAGDVSEILIFPRALTTSERLGVNQYLNTKYSLVPAVPATPTNLTATAISSNQIALTWDEPLNAGATQIGIQRSLSSNGVYQLIAQIPGADSYVDTNLAPGTTYYYQVSAINLTQWSPTSNVAQATTFLSGTSLPFGSLAMWLKADAGLPEGTNSGLLNSWLDQSPNGNNATQFNPANYPLWVPSVVGDRPVVRFNGSNSFFNLTGILNGAPGAEAYVVLKAATNLPVADASLWEMGGDSQSEKCYPNTDGSINDDFGGSVLKKTGIPQQPITQYHIYQVTAQTNNWATWMNGIERFQTSNNILSFAATPLLGLSTYQQFTTTWITVNSFFAGDIPEVLVFNRPLTTAERATVAAYLNGKYAMVPRLPATPTNLTATAISPTQVALSWNETLNAGATQISIERMSTFTGIYQAIAQVSDANSYMDTNALPGGTYYYRIRAINVDQWSPYSVPALVTTPANGNPLPLFALQLWLRADAGLWFTTTNTPVGFWVDQSGNNNSAVQLTPAYQPLWIPGTNGSLPTVQFNGTNSSLGLQNFLNGCGSAEAFVVLKSATTNTPQSLWEFGGDGNDQKYYPASNGGIVDDFGSASAQSIGVPAQPLNQFHVFEVSSAQDNWQAWINGQLLYQTSETGFNIVSFSEGLDLGYAPYGADDGFTTYTAYSYFAGDISEVLVFNRSLTDAERASVNTYLSVRYGFTPIITITNPVNEAVFNGSTNITIAATASDAAGIAQVQFFENGTNVATITNAPYSTVWSNAPLGSYALTAVATDNNSLLFTSAVVNVTVAGITLTSPTNGTVLPTPATFNLAATAVDGVGITNVQFFQGSTLIATVTNLPYTYSWTNVASGAYALTARATDFNGLILTSAVVNVTADNLPGITLTNPVNNARFPSGTNITLQASATDTDGTIASVKFFQNSNLLGTVTSSPYNLVWSNVTAGAYTLTAQATDNSGLSSNSAPVNIFVAGIVITNPPNNNVIPTNTSVIFGSVVTDNTNITSVQYYSGTTNIGSATTAPYSLTWTNTKTGIYSLSAKCTDAGGLVFISATNTLIVDTNSTSQDRDGDGVPDYIEYLEGRNPLVPAVPDTNNLINLQVYTPLQ